MTEGVNAHSRPVLHIVVPLAERDDTIMALGCAAHPVGVSDNVMHIDRPCAADKAGQLRDFGEVLPVRR
jgi:hypothetical protein